MTIVHHPLDTRILVRQIAALVDAGHVVTYAAPFSAHGVEPPVDVTTIDLPRSVGRRRLGALRAARRLLRQTAGDYDVVLIHDAELILAAASVRDAPVVWDVHEDRRSTAWRPAVSGRWSVGRSADVNSCWPRRRIRSDFVARTQWFQIPRSLRAIPPAQDRVAPYASAP
jgi:hypothetical protein